MNNAAFNNASLFSAPQPPVASNHHRAPKTPASICRLGTIVFLCSEAMLFSGLISAYLVVRASGGFWNWPPNFHDGMELPAMPKLLTGINTIILIGSSFAYHQAETEVKKGKSGSFFILLAAMMGATFVGIQCVEWTNLYHEGLWFNKGGVYGSSFFTLTGFHGAHVCIGVLLILWCFYLQVTKRTFTPERHVALENVGLYWHFVDVVWVFLYGILYWL